MEFVENKSDSFFGKVKDKVDDLYNDVYGKYPLVAVVFVGGMVLTKVVIDKRKAKKSVGEVSG